MSAAPLLLHLPDPVGWIALTPDALRDAQAAAREVLGVGAAATQDTPQPLGSTSLVTAEDAARQLSVNAQCLLRQAREGSIPYARIGRYVRFDPAAIAAYCTRDPRPRATTLGRRTT